MKYMALEDIGGYKKGEEVPAEKAIVWLQMYDVPHVEEVQESKAEDSKDEEPKVEDPKAKDTTKNQPSSKDKEKTAKESNPSDSSASYLHDDYLNRNKHVVLCNLAKDKLDIKTLESMISIEEKGKNRNSVLRALRNKKNNLVK